jgi:acyl-CoA synthetase (AMP-forming)/AMP-acid ligase II
VSNNPWTGEAAALAKRVEAFIYESLEGDPPEPFDELALDIHNWQRQRDPVLEALSDQAPERWQDIPAVPVDLFRRLRVGTVDPADAAVAFRTSGTTGARRGVHYMRATNLYDRGATAWFRQCVPDAPIEAAALLEDPAQASDSSLSHMVALFGPATWHLESGGLARTSLDIRIRTTMNPLFVAATGFALADWLSEEVPVLPPDSVLMVTGGFKGRRLTVAESDLYKQAEACLRPARIVTEYGMTELSSQLWGTPDTPYLPPPWLKVVAVSPASGNPMEPEHVGQLRFYDLCNLDGTLAIETMDEGVVHADGSVALYGRLEGAPLRGCSLTPEERWSELEGL